MKNAIPELMANLEFENWLLSDNVIRRKDGSFSTQDAQWRNRIKNLDGLRAYYEREFL